MTTAWIDTFRGRFFVLQALCVTAQACGSDATGSGPADVSISVAVVSGASAIVAVSVEITGQGIDSPLVFNFGVTNGIASGSVTVPAGATRRLVARGFDAGGIVTHRGEATITLLEGPNPAATLVLEALLGTQTITLTLGRNVIALNRRDTTLAVGDTLRLTAVATDFRGIPVSTGNIEWASRNPAIASVTTTGLVEARARGVTAIVAGYVGVVAYRAIAVQ